MPSRRSGSVHPFEDLLSLLNTMDWFVSSCAVENYFENLGYPVDENGDHICPVDDHGQPVFPVDINGNPVDNDGNPVDCYGDPVDNRNDYCGYPRVFAAKKKPHDAPPDPPAPVLDTPDTPPFLPVSDPWPSPEDFSPFVIQRYRDIPEGCYKLLNSFDHGVNKFGTKSLVLKLQDKGGAVLFVWATSSLACALTMRDQTRFIWNYGLKDDGEKSFYGFALC